MSSSTFHISLNVRDLAVTAEFLERLLGQRPARLHDDYAKFELADPPVVLSLAPTDVSGAALNHLGFRLSGATALAALKQRLTAAGIPFEVEESVACCHSQQSKLWVHDPAGNLWELYVLEDAGDCETDSADDGASPSLVTIAAPPTAARAMAAAASSTQARPIRALPTASPKQSATWSHRLGETFPAQLPAAAASLDEVILEGTINDSPAAVDLAQVLAEVARVLRPGGRLLVHGLTADSPLNQPPRLPGPAAAVQHVPTTCDLLAAIQTAGFAGLELATFGETYRFQHAGAELRETRLTATRLGPQATASHTVFYRGPFAELRDDAGHIFRRGEPTRIDAATHARLKNSSSAAQFVFTN